MFVMFPCYSHKRMICPQIKIVYLWGYFPRPPTFFIAPLTTIVLIILFCIFNHSTGWCFTSKINLKSFVSYCRTFCNRVFDLSSMNSKSLGVDFPRASVIGNTKTCAHNIPTCCMCTFKEWYQYLIIFPIMYIINHVMWVFTRAVTIHYGCNNSLYPQFNSQMLHLIDLI